jgi:flagellar protein FliS
MMNPYFEQMVLSASPVELLRLLYQRAISAVRDAREHLREKRIAERCASLNIAYAVLTELTSSLRADDAPELSANLNALYGYMQQRLLDGNLNQDDEPLREVLGLLSTLAEAWQAVPDPWSAEAVQHPLKAVASTNAGHDGGRRIAVSA